MNSNNNDKISSLSNCRCKHGRNMSGMWIRDAVVVVVVLVVARVTTEFIVSDRLSLESLMFTR